jgi:hypothetical protein
MVNDADWDYAELGRLNEGEIAALLRQEREVGFRNANTVTKNIVLKLCDAVENNLGSKVANECVSMEDFELVHNAIRILLDLRSPDYHEMLMALIWRRVEVFSVIRATERVRSKCKDYFVLRIVHNPANETQKRLSQSIKWSIANDNQEFEMFGSQSDQIPPEERPCLLNGNYCFFCTP